MPSIIVEYVWISGKDTHHDLRSKCKTVTNLDKPLSEVTAADLPEWNFDGSSTAQAKGRDTEILIRPVSVYPHPFVPGGTPALVALCECYLPSGEPTPDNTRYMARQVFEDKNAQGHEPWYGMEQEYVLMQGERPYGWPETGEPKAQGDYYCGNGPSVAYGRKYTLRHYELCLKMGLKISGTNAEVMPGQWEYQVGPCKEIECGDHVVMSRWCYLRVLEEADEANLDVNFEVKPKKGDWNGSGLHTNFSTNETRADGGLEKIKLYFDRLKKTFPHDIVFYSADNNERMTGLHETSTLNEFTWGVGTRGTSCRLPNQVNKDGKGYLEDRRPGADADPYLISSRLFASCCDIPCPALDKMEEQLRQPWMASIENNLNA